MNKNPLVSVICITYNQAPFVERAIYSFLKQKTNFDFEIIIHDDCSNDGTEQIIKKIQEKYPEKITLLTEKENQFSKGVNIAYDILLPIIRGKYVACCEGDDCWIDENKLQIQADFMEMHPNYTLYCHNGIKHNNITEENTIVNPFPKSGRLTEEQIILSYSNDPPTASYFLKRTAACDLPKSFIHAPVVDDIVKLYCMTKGSIWYDDRIMSHREFKHETSWNAKIAKNIELLHYYTFGMLDFYYKFDMYTQNRYHKYILIVENNICLRLLKKYKEIDKNDEFLRNLKTEMELITKGDDSVLSQIPKSRNELFKILWGG